MPDTIRDGTGGGNLTKVDSDNNLHTLATTIERITEISEDKQMSFSVYGKRNFASGSADEGILYLKYTGTGSLHIQRIFISTNSTGAKIEVYFDVTSQSGGTTIVPLNLNRGSSIASETTCVNGASVITATTDNANEFLDIRLNTGSFSVELGGGVILRKDNNIYILGEVASASDKIRAMVYFYEESD